MEKNTQKPENSTPEFGIQRLYLKDLSLETPNSPEIFLAEWKPELHLDLETKTKEIEKNLHEVVLCVTATVKIKEKVAFLVEVHQAGIFSIVNFPKEQMRSMLGAFCPDVLYPYAREAITSVVVKAGFPQLYLAPVNFEGMLAEQDAAKEKESVK